MTKTPSSLLPPLLVLIALLVGPSLTSAGAAQSAPEAIRWLRPEAGVPVFGRVEIEVAISPDFAVERVELRCDGRRFATLTAPPWTAAVDVGEDNASHRFEAVAYGAAGEIARGARSTPAIRVDEVVDLQLRQLYLTVTDRKGNPVAGLTPDSFEVQDEGVPQEIVTVGTGELPFTALLLMDASSSMEGGNLKTALEGVKSFARSMRPLDEARLFAFAHELLAVSPFTQDPEALTAAASTSLGRGGTAVFDHLFMALRALEGRQGRPVVILLSDGYDVHSVLRPEQVHEAIRRSQAMLYWLRLEERSATGLWFSSFYSPRESQRRRELLARYARETGGRALDVRGAAGIAGALQEVLEELRSQYALGYYPKPEAGTGRWREVRIELKQRGARLRAREGYADF